MRHLLVLLALCTFGAVSCADTPEAPTVTSSEETSTPEVKVEPPIPYLWKVTKGDGQYAYLFGTIHIGDPRATTLGPDVTAAFDDATDIITEIPMDPGTMVSVQQKMMLTDGRTLQEIIGDQLYLRIDAFMKSINPMLSAGVFQKMHPGAVGVSLGVVEHQIKNPFDVALDMQLSNKAKAAKKRTGGLETVDEQIAVITGFTDEESSALISMTLDALDAMKKDGADPIEMLMEVYVVGDNTKFKELMNAYMEEQHPVTDKFYAQFLTMRNVRMAERAAKMMADNPNRIFFFAVGAAHLGHDDGVQVLMEAMDGFEVERLAGPETP